MTDTTNRLNIAVLTALDVRDRRSWSGTFYSIAQTLQMHCGDVTCIGPMHAFHEMVFGWLRHKCAQVFLHKKFAFRHSYAVAKRYARIAEQRLANRPFDVIIALSGATEIAFLKTDVPIVLVEDANFAILRDYHQHFSDLLDSSAREIDSIQDRGITRADMLLYPTVWAAQSAVKNYHADQRKICVIPFGANLEEVPARDRVLARRRSAQCTLLFVGVDWTRKGGEIAFETLIELEKMGIQAQMIICGCVPPAHVSHPRLTVIPFLDKNDAVQRKKLEALYLSADFLLLPTRNECFGIALCEANAFGLPVITTQTGGVAEVIHNGENGFTLPYGAGGDAYAKVIATVYRDEVLYNRLVQTSRRTFEERLNWDAWGINTRDVLMNMLNRKKPRPAFDLPMPITL